MVGSKTSFAGRRPGSGTYRQVPVTVLREEGAPDRGVQVVQETGQAPDRGTGRHSVDKAVDRAHAHGWTR